MRLVGVMDAQDAVHIQALVPHARYKRIPVHHVIHLFKSRAFVQAVEEFVFVANDSRNTISLIRSFS